MTIQDYRQQTNNIGQTHPNNSEMTPKQYFKYHLETAKNWIAELTNMNDYIMANDEERKIIDNSPYHKYF